VKHLIILLAMLTAGGFSHAFADPPASPAAPESQSTTTQDSAAQSNKSQSSASQTTPATAAATGAKAPAVAAAKPAPSVSDEEKQLLAQGYHVHVMRGEKVYCKREIPIGSTLPEMRCMSADEAKEMTKAGRELMEQQNRIQGR
jgi:hypothetical protein